MATFSVDARRLGLGEGQLRPGPAVWCVAVVAALALPIYPSLTPFTSSFARYRQAGAWIAEHPEVDGKVLDLTDWSLFFSERSGGTFQDIPRLADDPKIRYVVVRESQLAADNHVATMLKSEFAGSTTVADYPAAKPGGNRVMVFDLGDGRAEAVARRTGVFLDDSSRVIRR